MQGGLPLEEVQLNVALIKDVALTLLDYEEHSCLGGVVKAMGFSQASCDVDQGVVFGNRRAFEVFGREAAKVVPAAGAEEPKAQPVHEVNLLVQARGQ